MADTENREDQKISECLREAFGYSDDQLLKQLDQANETFKDVNFTGAEDRLMKRFLARKAELEKETATQTPTPVPHNESANTQIAEELPKKNITVISELEEKKKNEKKVIRFGKKKVLATAALVAVIAGMLGGTAIGKKSYFFNVGRKEAVISLDNDKNLLDDSQLEQAYEKIEQESEIPTLKMGYCPEKLKFKSCDIYEEGVQIEFSYEGKSVYFIQREKEISVSAEIKSDRKKERRVFNKWLNKEIEYYTNNLQEGNQECESIIVVNNSYYYLFGYIGEAEFEKILEYLYFS